MSGGDTAPAAGKVTAEDMEVTEAAVVDGDAAGGGKVRFLSCHIHELQAAESLDDISHPFQDGA